MEQFHRTMARKAQQLLVSPEFFIVHASLSPERVRLHVSPLRQQEKDPDASTGTELTIQLGGGQHKVWLGGLGATDQNAEYWKNSNLELLRAMTANALQPENLIDGRYVGFTDIYPPSVVEQPTAYAWALGPEEKHCTALNATWGVCQPTSGKNAVCDEDPWTCCPWVGCPELPGWHLSNPLAALSMSSVASAKQYAAYIKELYNMIPTGNDSRPFWVRMKAHTKNKSEYK